MSWIDYDSQKLTYCHGSQSTLPKMVKDNDRGPVGEPHEVDPLVFAAGIVHIQPLYIQAHWKRACRVIIAAALGQAGSDGLHEQDLHDDVFAPADVVRSPRVAEQVSGSVLTATVWVCKHAHTHTHTHTRGGKHSPY